MNAIATKLDIKVPTLPRISQETRVVIRTAVRANWSDIKYALTCQGARYYYTFLAGAVFGTLNIIL